MGLIKKHIEWFVAIAIVMITTIGFFRSLMSTLDFRIINGCLKYLSFFIILLLFLYQKYTHGVRIYDRFFFSFYIVYCLYILVDITSRFHGFASALNSCVPCLATSWSHKYEELYHDYGLDDYVLPLDDNDVATSRVRELFEEKENKRLREHLRVQVPKVKEQTREMWNEIWNLR